MKVLLVSDLPLGAANQAWLTSRYETIETVAAVKRGDISGIVELVNARNADAVVVPGFGTRRRALAQVLAPVVVLAPCGDDIPDSAGRMTWLFERYEPVAVG